MQAAPSEEGRATKGTVGEGGAWSYIRGTAPLMGAASRTLASMSEDPKKTRSARVVQAALDGARAGLTFPPEHPEDVAIVVRFAAEARRAWLAAGATVEHAAVLMTGPPSGFEYTEDAPRVMVMHAAQAQITLEMTMGERGREMGKALDKPPGGFFPVVGIGRRTFVTFLAINEQEDRPDGG